MKHIVVTDTHLGLYGASDLWHSISIELFQDIRKTGKKTGIRSILHCGDFFHNRRETNTKTMDAAQHIVSTLLHDFNFNIVIGNHDAYFKNKLFPNSLQTLKGEMNVRIISEAKVLPEDKNIIMCPWSGDLSGMPTGKYVFGHFEINGFLMNSSYRCKTGIDKSTLEAHRHVFSGHFHTPSTKSNITYLGSPYGQTWHDVNATRGYYIFDSDTGKLDFIEFENAPKFIVVGSENDIDEEQVKGNFVKLLFQKDYGHINNQKIVDGVLSKKPISLIPDFSQANFMGTEERQESEDLKIMDHNDIVREYVDKLELPDHIKKQTLIGFMEKLMV